MLYAATPAAATAGCQTVDMRPGLRITRAVAALGGATALFVYAFSGVGARAADTTVTATSSNTFDPATVTVDVGDTVTWEWRGSFGHTVTSTSGNWNKDDSLGPPAANISTQFLFEKPGTYTYVCKTHESVGMKGTVIVRGSTPKPTRTTRPPTRSPSPTRSSSRPATSAPSESASASASSAAPPILISGSPVTTPPATAPAPSLAPTPTAPPFLGTGGLTPPPPTGRIKGLPVMLALLLVFGVGAGEVRALLANA